MRTGHDLYYRLTKILDVLVDEKFHDSRDTSFSKDLKIKTLLQVLDSSLERVD